jgi:hypothetical protein
MDAVLMTKLQVGRTHSPGSREVTVVAAYEDANTEARVQQFCSSLQAQMNGSCALVKQMWPMSELRLPQLRSIAAGEAAQAEVLIVSLHHGNALPPPIQSWLEQWVGCKNPASPGVLLALLDPPSAGLSAELQASLKALAARAHMEYLVQTEDTWDDL